MDRTEAYSIETENNLSTMYRFENYVLCDGNILAYSAAKAIVTNEKKYNPFCIVGTKGNGKTHLLQAIGNAIVEKEPDKKVFYSTTEAFVNDVLNAIKSGHTHNLRQRYRTVDVLLLDDIHFIEGKAASGEELSHVIDLLYRSGKQIVLTADKAPKEMADLNDHLLNLINSGLVMAISAPDKAMKESIVRAKAKEAGVMLRDEVVDYISERSHSNVSEIVGVITSIVAYSELSKPMISLDEAKAVLKTVLSES